MIFIEFLQVTLAVLFKQNEVLIFLIKSHGTKLFPIANPMKSAVIFGLYNPLVQKTTPLGMMKIDNLNSDEGKLLHLFGRDIIRMEGNLTFNTYSYLDIEYSGEYYNELLGFVENYISKTANP